MTKQEVVLDLLQYIGVFGFGAEGANSLNENSADEGDIVKAIAAVNSALQELYRDGPDSLRHDKQAQYFHAPTPITLTATKGTKAAVSTVAASAWMKGCSVIIAGDGDLNEIADINGTAITLLRAYTGTSNSGLLSTVYNDAAILDKGIVTVLEPVEITPNIRLIPAQSRNHFDHLAYMRQDYNFGVPRRGYYTSGTNKQVGMPMLYLASELVGQQIVMRLNPMPPSALNVTFHCDLAPDLIVREDDLDETGAEGSDPGELFTGVPDFMVESILLPIARGKFLSHPALKNSAVAPVLKVEYDAAKLSLTTKPARSVHTTRARYC